MAKSKTITITKQFVNNSSTPTTISKTVEPVVVINGNGGALVADKQHTDPGVMINTQPNLA